AVDAHLKNHRQVLANAIPQIVSTLLDRAEQLGPASGVPAFQPLLALTDAMSDEQSNRLRRLIHEAILHLGPNTLDPLRPTIDQAARQEAFSDDYDLLAREVWDSVKGQQDPQQALLLFVVGRFGRLDDDRRAAFFTQFGNWVTQYPPVRVRL